MKTISDNSPALVLLAQIVRCGSMTAAAKQLGIGRAAVSKQLRTLEKSMGVRLLQRSTRHLSLTEVGEQVLKQAHIIEKSLQTVDAIGSIYQQETFGKLKVSCTTAIGRTHLVPLMGKFAAMYPKIEVNLQLEDRFVDLIAEQVDVSIRIGFMPDSTLVARQLGQLKWQLCASPCYLAKWGVPKKPADLLEHNCIYYRNAGASMNTWGFIGETGSEYVTVSGTLAMNDANALVDATLNGVGILHIDNALLDKLETGELVTVLPDYKSMPGPPVYAVYPARDLLPAKTEAFVSFLVDYLSPKI